MEGLIKAIMPFSFLSYFLYLVFGITLLILKQNSVRKNKMGLWDWFISKPKKRNKKWRKPLYRIGKRVYWKGIPVDDDEFEAVRMDNKELREYNSYVKKYRRKLFRGKHRRRHRRK